MHEQEPRGAPSGSASKELQRWCGGRMTSMAGRYLRDEPGAVRDLALLRRVSNTAPAFTHEVWRLLADLPAQLRGHGDLPSRGERAAIAALGLVLLVAG